MSSETSSVHHSASFRDPSGFLFWQDGKLLRQINKSYRENYERLNSSGLYADLVERKLLIPHTESDCPLAENEVGWKVIEPEMVAFISYPYEWCFSQYKDAALATLDIQQAAIEHNMSLKDASAYNIQFHNGKALMIDTLSFEALDPEKPWTAYRQFCQHFLAPLSLMSHCDVRLANLMRDYIDGIPLDLASTLLPRATKFNLALQLHIHLHARSQEKYADKKINKGQVKGKMTRHNLLALIDNLKKTITGLKWKAGETEWGDYYNDTNYSDDSFSNKKKIIDGFISTAEPLSVWDLGANNGLFSRIASDRGIPTVAFDIDPVAVEKCYHQMVEKNETNMLPLVQDLTNPSPAIGWHHNERDSLSDRGAADMVFSLALIHHLAISNNLPFSRIASFMASVCSYLVIEFVPKSDSQVQRLLTTREDIFTEYTQECFEQAFGEQFDILETVPVEGSERTLYLMRR